MIKAYKSAKPSQNKKEFTTEKVGGDQSKIEKIDISILTKNITNLFDQIKTVTNDIQIKNILIEN